MTDFENNQMLFVESDTPYIELETGENADLYHYRWREVCCEKNRIIKHNHVAFGRELEKRWNAYETLKEAAEQDIFTIRYIIANWSVAGAIGLFIGFLL